MSSNSNAKGEDYFLSHVTTLDRVEATNYPWVYSYFYNKFIDLKIIRDAQNICKKFPSFFMLVLWTFAIFSLVSFLLLPAKVFLFFNNFLQTLISFIAPCLVCFLVYLWTGLALKFYKLKFEVRKCFISCVILEVLVEIFTKTGLTYFAKSAVLGITLSFIVLSTGFSVMQKKYSTLSALISSIIILRFFVIENLSMFSNKQALPPLLAYISLMTGLAISTLPTIQIPDFNEESYERSTTTSTSSRANSLSPFDMSTIPVIRQRRASSVEIPTAHQNGGLNHLQQKNRRKSLPTLGMPARKVSMSSMDLTILGEAHGMISDLLADSSLPMNVTGTLRIVADMISPLLQHSFQRQQQLPTSQQLLTVYEKHLKEDEQQVINQPDLKDDTPLSLKQRLQRNLGVSSRRMSSSYTTTTSATGMPTIDMEYHAKKNAMNNINTKRQHQHRSKSYAGVFTATDKAKAFANKSHSFSQSTTCSSPPPTRSPRHSESRASDDDIFKVEITRGKPVYFEGMDSDTDEQENDCSAEQSPRTRPSNDDLTNKRDTLDSNKLSKKLSSLSESGEDLIDSTDQEVADTLSKNDVAASQPNIHLDRNSKTNSPLVSSTPDKDIIKNNHSDRESPQHLANKLSENSIPPLAHRKENLNIAEVAPVQKIEHNQENNHQQSPRESLTLPTSQRRRSSRELHLEYETAVSYDVDSLLVKLNEWDFPIFELSEKCNVLTQLAFRIFQICGFFSSFKISESTFLKYFRALESGYHNIPYHNRIHAADVLHGVYYLTQHKIPGFSNRSNSRRSSQDGSIAMEDDYIEDEYTYGCISDSMPELELMALYTAAAMHDFDHPGRTNAFLVATLNPKALLYNDRSVLENHHAAASWSLLVTNPGLNFLSGLDPVEFKRFRFIVIEQILSTDLKKHFDFLTEWNAKVSGDGLNFANEADRLLVGQMAIKLADISGPSKEWNLHCRWTDRIIEEFYQQGEDEKTLGMPLSPYMDRNDPKVPQLQASFIKHLVSPLYMAYEKAGIMPGEWMENEEGEDCDEAEESVESATDADGSDVEKDSDKQKKQIYSIVIDNIHKNHEKWLKIIDEEDEEVGTAGNDGGENGSDAVVVENNTSSASSKNENNDDETEEITENDESEK